MVFLRGDLSADELSSVSRHDLPLSLSFYLSVCLSVCLFAIVQPWLGHCTWTGRDSVRVRDRTTQGEVRPPRLVGLSPVAVRLRLCWDQVLLRKRVGRLRCQYAPKLLLDQQTHARAHTQLSTPGLPLLGGRASTAGGQKRAEMLWRSPPVRTASVGTPVRYGSRFCCASSLFTAFLRSLKLVCDRWLC